MNKDVMKVRRDSWRKVIMAQKESGLSITKWCENNGIRQRQFHYWQKVLRDEDLLKCGGSLNQTPDIAGQDHGDEDLKPLSTVSGQTFVEMPDVSACVSASRPPSAGQLQETVDSGILIQHGEILIRISNGFDEGTLSGVLRVVCNAQ